MAVLNKIRACFLGKSGDLRSDSWLLVLLITGFLGFLSLRGWMNVVLILLFATSLGYGWSARKSGMPDWKPLQPVIIVFAMPVLAILLSQALRQDWILKAYDGPLRMLMAIPVLLYFYVKRVDFSRVIAAAVPASLLILVAEVYLNPQVVTHWNGRFATYFVDCDTFGVYTLVLCALCLFGVMSGTGRGWRAWQTLGALVGLYLLLGSKTRSAWLALPFVLVIWLMLKAPHVGWRKTLGLFAAVALITGLGAVFFPSTIDRFQSGVHEIAGWMNGTNPDTSAGLRLTMWRMSWALIEHSPLYGYGDFGYRNLLTEPWITSISTFAARQTISAGPHNEIIANLLRSGIFGGISIISYFVLLFIYFWRERRHPDKRVVTASHLGMAYLVCLFIAGIDFEVFTLKYTSSFNGFMIAGLAAQVAWVKSEYLARDRHGD
jgi:O-antigen ligase